MLPARRETYFLATFNRSKGVAEGRPCAVCGGFGISQADRFAVTREGVFRFHDELNDFLPPERRDTEFPHSFLLPASIKDVIEAFGVPHPEVELILVNSVPVDFSYLVQEADRVSVYPASASLPVTSVVQLRPQLQVFGLLAYDAEKTQSDQQQHSANRRARGGISPKTNCWKSPLPSRP